MQMGHNQTTTHDPRLQWGGGVWLHHTAPSQKVFLIMLYFKRGGGTIKIGGGTIIRVTDTITPPSMGNCTTMEGLV